MIRRRREMLMGATSVIASAGALPKPAISQGLQELSMVTSWSRDSAGMQMSADRLARTITTMSEGRLKVSVYPDGSLVRAYEVFDAVSAGAADMYHTGEGIFEQKSLALNFFCGTIPYGLTADEICAWLIFGGGQALWDEVDDQFNIKPLMAANSGVQMGGWFTKEVNIPEDYKGLRYRMPGLGAEVLRRMGAIAVAIPGGEIASALKSGAIDASEWVGPWLDMELGLHEVAKYYYCPGFHEAGTNFTLGINKTVWNRLPASDRALIEAAAGSEVSRSLAQFNAENARALRRLRDEKRVQIMPFNNAMVRASGKLAKEVLADAAGTDPLVRKVYDSYTAFLVKMIGWTELSEHGYLETRRLALS